MQVADDNSSLTTDQIWPPRISGADATQLVLSSSQHIHAAIVNAHRNLKNVSLFLTDTVEAMTEKQAPEQAVLMGKFLFE